MTEAATRVVLLARPGAACERLTAALQEAGANLVLTADPIVADAGSIAAANAQAILIALEPAVEDALDRFDAVLADPAITVIYDESELAAQREGWDAARWVRHLAAKLNRHGDVLPPGAESDPDDGNDMSHFANQARSRAQVVPRDLPTEGMTVADDPTSVTVPATADSGAVKQRFQQDLEDLDRRIADITLTDPGSYGHGPRRGAVLIEGGMGGPDAVRQLLGGMPAEFPRPILVRLHLDGGRYDRLVRQMSRATALAVVLAKPGQIAEPGQVYFMPPSLGLEEQAARLVFVAADSGTDSLLSALPAGDSALVLLSGSDPLLVDAAMSHAWSGALVVGQSSDGCYDAAASDALVARGGEAATPAELARRLTDRWPT